MTIKKHLSELTIHEINYFVAISEKRLPVFVKTGDGKIFGVAVNDNYYSPSTDWTLSGKFIAELKISVSPTRNLWKARFGEFSWVSATPLEAICRCIILARLGVDVDMQPVCRNEISAKQDFRLNLF